MKRYRAGIVGCGRIASTLDEDPRRKNIWTHAGAYRASADVEVVAASDLNPEALSRFGQRWRVSRLYPDYRQMLRDEHLDLLSVCTHADSHRDIALAGRQAGVRSVWCEKPMARSVEEAEEIEQACRDIVVAVNHTRRWDPCYRRARELLQSGVIGELQAVTCYYCGGVVNIGSHLFDMLRFLFGDVEWVSAHADGSRRSDPDISGDLYFRRGLLGHVISCDPARYLIFELDVLGTEGRLRIVDNGARIELWRVGDSPRYSGVRELAKDEGTPGTHGWTDERMLTAVSEIVGCLERGGQPACSAADGRAALELVAAFCWSLRESTRVALPLSGRARAMTIPG